MNVRATIGLFLVAGVLFVVFILMKNDILSVGGNDEEEEEVETGNEVLSLFEEAQGDVVESFRIVHNDTGQVFAAEFMDLAWTVTESVTEVEEGMVDDVLRLDAASRTLPTLTSTRQLSELEVLAEFGAGICALHTNLQHTWRAGVHAQHWRQITPGHQLLCTDTWRRCCSSGKQCQSGHLRPTLSATRPSPNQRQPPNLYQPPNRNCLARIDKRYTLAG